VTAPTANDSAGIELANTGATWLIQNDDTSSEALTFDRAGTERMRIDSSGRVFMGKTTSNFAITGVELHGDGTGIFTKSSSTPLTINRTTNDGGLVAFYKDGTNVGAIGVASGDLNINGGANHSGIRFQATGLYPLENGTASSGEIDLGAAGSKFKNLYLNGGVYLGGTGAANHLDDYEEGTFTPTANTNITSITNGDGHYVKVGNLVTVMFYATIDPASTTLNLFIGGLPFAVADNFSLTNVGATGLLFEDNSIFTIWAQETSSNVVVEFDRPLQGSTSSTSKNYRGTLTYFTA
jgi:hypothetical protein